MNDTVFMITTFCDNFEKLSALEKNIEQIKIKGHDVAVISSIPIPEVIQKKTDYSLITKENPILKWPESLVIFWNKIVINNQIYTIQKSADDYGFAVFLKVKRLLELLKNYHYEKFVLIDYDTIIEEHVFDEIENETESKMFPSKRGETIWEVGLHLLILHRRHIDEFISDISKENYLNFIRQNRGGNIFDWLKQKGEKLNFKISENHIEDFIYNFSDKDPTSFSDDKRIDFHISKPQNEKECQLTFFNIKEDLKVHIEINNTIIFDEKVTKEQIINLGVSVKEIKTIQIKIDSTKYNLTEKFDSVTFSELIL